jgi:hypothetical protein
MAIHVDRYGGSKENRMTSGALKEGQGAKVDSVLIFMLLRSDMFQNQRGKLCVRSNIIPAIKAANDRYLPVFKAGPHAAGKLRILGHQVPLLRRVP